MAASLALTQTRLEHQHPQQGGARREEGDPCRERSGGGALGLFGSGEMATGGGTACSALPDVC